MPADPSPSVAVLRRKRERALSRVFPWLLTIILLAALVWGLEEVVYQPLRTGESYPAFSSLRPDPDGALALYESLAAMPGIRVDRLYKERQSLNPDETLFVLGVFAEGWFEVSPDAPAEEIAAKNATLKQYEILVKNGGRLVLCFLPARTPGSESKKLSPVVARWNLDFKYRPGMDDYSNGGIPRQTALYFDPKDPAWHALTASDGKAETVERAFGKGAIVLAADTFPLSNQGLRDDRQPQFIATLVGSSTHVVFDENHFGVVESGSIVKLMRRYRLQGAIAVLFAIAILFLWRAASSLLPPRSSGPSKSSVAGRDSLEGLASLLHRGVPEKQLLETCYAEWSKSAPRASISRAERMRAGIAAHPDAPVDAYKAACRILTEHTP